MGNKVEAYFQVEFGRVDERHIEIMVRAKNISMARAAFWAAVDARASTMAAQEWIRLTHGARTIIAYPPSS